MVSAITSELAPAYVADTTTCGGVIDGYSSNGSCVIIKTPASIIASDITIANFGLFINKFPDFVLLSIKISYY